MKKSDETDHLITNSVDEKNQAIVNGWSELCNPIGGPSVFCVDAQETDGRSGPFMIYSVPVENTSPIFRCKIGEKHFFSTSTDCEG